MASGTVRIKSVCSRCGSEFEAFVSASLPRNFWPKFCGRACRQAALREHAELEREDRGESRAAAAKRRAKHAAERKEARRQRLIETHARHRELARKSQRAQLDELVAEAKKQGLRIRNGVCAHCGAKFKWFEGVLDHPAHPPSRAYGGVRKISGPEAPRVPGTASQPSKVRRGDTLFCSDSCLARWQYEHGGKEKAEAQQKARVAAGGRWVGRKFVMPPQGQQTVCIVTRRRGGGGFYDSGPKVTARMGRFVDGWNSSRVVEARGCDGSGPDAPDWGAVAAAELEASRERAKPPSEDEVFNT